MAAARAALAPDCPEDGIITMSRPIPAQWLERLGCAGKQSSIFPPNWRMFIEEAWKHPEDRSSL
jgi:hypothetical protein